MKEDKYKRAAKGKFAAGNCGGPGNPLAKRVNKLRAKFLDGIEKNDSITKAVEVLAQAATGGELTSSQLNAIREILDRTGCDVRQLTEERRVDVEAKIADLQDQVEGL